jgi:putative transposase
MTHSQDHMNVGVSPRNQPNLKPYHQGMVGIKRMVAGGDTFDSPNTPDLFEVFVLKYPHFNPEKYGLKVKVAEVKATSHTKYNINYHVIWIPKYRKPILTGRVKQYLDDIIRYNCEYHGWECLALEIMPDHIHLFLSARPNWPPSKIVNILKGSTSKYLRDRFPRLKYLGYKKRVKRFPNLWARGYYCGTAGHVSQEQVIRYIMEQDGVTPFNYDIRNKQNLEVKT